MTIGSQRAIRVLGFAGSLRRGSYNRALLRAASELAPELDFADFCPGFRRRSRRLPLPQ